MAPNPQKGQNYVDEIFVIALENEPDESMEDTQPRSYVWCDFVSDEPGNSVGLDPAHCHPKPIKFHRRPRYPLILGPNCSQ